MAFNVANLVYPSYQIGLDSPVLWRYSTDDDLSVVEATSPKYFANAVGMLRTGDAIGVTAGDGKRFYLVGDGSPSIIFQANVSSFRWD